MQTKIIQAIIVFLGCGTIICLLSLLVFNLRLNNNQQELQAKAAILTSSNDYNWAQSPGKDIDPIYNRITLFSRVSKMNESYVELEPLNYIYQFKYMNLTYEPSTDGYVSFYPYNEYIPLSDESEQKVTQVNLVSAKKFYQGMNAPPMQRVTSYLNMILNSLEQDLITRYVSETIHQFYIKDLDLTTQTIFNYAGLDQYTINNLWSDSKYGWSDPSTFKYWVQVCYEVQEHNFILYQEFKSRFQLSQDQMQVLVGDVSLLSGMIRMVHKVLSDYIKYKTSVSCKQENCNRNELGRAQWGNGYVTESNAFPGTQYPSGGYSAINDTISGQFEYYLNDNQITVDVSFGITYKNFEFSSSLFCFNSINSLLQQPNNYQKINALFSLTNEDVAKPLSQYLLDIQSYQGQQYRLAQQIYNYISDFISEGTKLLNFGLYAKAIINQNLDCNQVLSGYPFQQTVCDKVDFTKSYQAAKLWVEAYFVNRNTQNPGFIALLNQIGQQYQSQLLTLLYDQQFANIIKPILIQAATQYKCLSQNQCELDELFQIQWVNCQVSQNPPLQYNLSEQDKVCGVSLWEQSTDQQVNYELAAYLKEMNYTNTFKQISQLFSYDSGGILGYFSLLNLTSAVYNETQLNPKFQLTQDQAHYLVKYLTQGLLRYRYGGLWVQTNSVDYLWRYENQYTKELDQLTPLDGGAQWKSNAEYLIKKNNQDFIDSQTPDDKYFINTGIQDLDKVRNIVKILSDFNIKSKKIVYKNKTSKYNSPYYYYPFGNVSVQGNQVLGFRPNLDNSDLELFSDDLLRSIKLKYSGSTQYLGSDVNIYNIPPQSYEMQSIEGYPLVITIGNPKLTNCQVTFNQTNCQQYLDQFFEDNPNQILVDKLSGLTLQIQINMIYWIDIDEQSILKDDQYIKTHGLKPLAKRVITMQQIKQNLQQLNDIQQQRKLQYIIISILSGLFGLAFIVLLVYYCKNKGNIRDGYSNLPSSSQN